VRFFWKEKKPEELFCRFVCQSFRDLSAGSKSGAKATAVQTLRESLVASHCAKRLDCGRFTAAFSCGDTNPQADEIRS